MPQNVDAPHQRVIARSPAENPVLMQAAIEGHVLVKNVNNALPLRSPKLLSMFGYDARAPDDLTYSLWLSQPSAYANFTLYVAGGSGSNSPAYVNSPFDALTQQAIVDGTSLLWDFYTQTPAVDPTSDVCIVFINAYAQEGSDRPDVDDEYSDTIVNNVADRCSNTVVVIHNAGIRLVDSFVEHPNVTAIIYAHLPGQDTGAALVDILYGRANPSGRLPYTVAKQASDYGALLAPDLPEGEFWLFPQSNFSEGVYIDYRAFDAQGITPRYEFGYGLSYTTFDYSDLVINAKHGAYSRYPPAAAIVQGGNPRLWDELVTVSAVVHNSGGVAGQEVAQLYLGIPNGPIRQLRGFDKVTVAPGQKVQVEFTLTRKDLSTWDVDAQQWLLQHGAYQVYVGRSSRDLPLQGHFTI